MITLSYSDVLKYKKIKQIKLNDVLYSPLDVSAIDLYNSEQCIPHNIFTPFINVTNIYNFNNVLSFDSEFDVCNKLSNICLNDTLNYLRHNAFEDTSILSIHIPVNLNCINNETFMCCIYLKYIDFNNTTISSIGDYAFDSCISLSSIKIPQYVKFISHGAFANCVNLHKVLLPSTIEYIGGDVFENCTSLSNVTFY